MTDSTPRLRSPYIMILGPQAEEHAQSLQQQRETLALQLETRGKQAELTSRLLRDLASDPKVNLDVTRVLVADAEKTPDRLIKLVTGGESVPRGLPAISVEGGL